MDRQTQGEIETVKKQGGRDREGERGQAGAEGGPQGWDGSVERWGQTRGYGTHSPWGRLWALVRERG